MCVYRINNAEGGNPIIGCRTASAPDRRSLGAVDSIIPGPGNVRMKGWVIDPDAGAPIKLHVYIDNTFKGEFTTPTGPAA